MSYTVVIPSRDDANLAACLRALFQNQPSAKVIVVDDGLRCADQFRDLATVIPGEKPFIFARNCNLGIRAAHEDVVLLNDDALLTTPGGFDVLADASARPDVGIVGATTNLTGQPLQWNKHVGLRKVPHFAFVCVYIPWRTIELLGPLDERYCIDYGVEDRDYCEAVNRAGFGCYVHDGCFVDHGSLHSTFRGDPKAPKSFSENLKLFNAKWGMT